MGEIACGRMEIEVTGVAIQLGENTSLDWLIVQGVWGNGEVVAVGDANVTYDSSPTDGIRLDPGQFAPQAGACNRGDVFINGKKGDAVNYWTAYTMV